MQNTKTGNTQKFFGITKTGYSSGVYGCSNEFFTLIYLDNTRLNSISFKGLYGASERVGEAMKGKGYSESYLSSVIGKVIGEDKKFAMGEKEIIEIIKNTL
jgi:hypothetical protein